MKSLSPQMNKLTILVESDVYEGLQSKIGRGKISKFINDTVKPFVLDDGELRKQYQELADSSNKKEVQEWFATPVVINSENVW